MTDAPLVLPLEAVDPTDPDTLGRVGGKAANLGALVRAGFAVPAGVCLTTAAYRRAVGSALDALLAEGTDAVGLAEKARAAVLAVPIPDEVADAVRGDLPRGAGRGPLVGDGRGPAGRELRRSAGHVPGASSATTRCSTRSVAAGPRSGPTGPSPTAAPTTSTTPRSRSPW